MLQAKTESYFASVYILHVEINFECAKHFG